MDSRYDSALVALECQMRLNLSVERMIPLLERDAGGFMIKAERMQVTSVNRENTPEMVSRIVSILRKKGNEHFFSFLEILDKSGNEVWANKLREHAGLPQLDKLAVPCSEENPQIDQLVENKDSQIITLDKLAVPCSEENPQEDQLVENKDSQITLDKLAVPCSEENPQEDQLVENKDSQITYATQVNSEDLSESLLFEDIIEESTLECPPPPSERNSLSERTGLPERLPSRKGGDYAEDLHEDVDKLAVQYTEENPQIDQLVDNEDSQITFFHSKKNEDPNKLTIKALMPYIGELASLGLQISGWLDISNEWTTISKTPGSPGEHLQQLLMEWLKRDENPDVPHTWKHFIGVVRNCKRGKLAEKMEREVFGIFTQSGGRHPGDMRGNPQVPPSGRTVSEPVPGNIFNPSYVPVTTSIEGAQDLLGDEFEEVIKSHACIELTITKCTTIGPPRVGKTCLKHLLTGKEWDVEKEMPSTPAVRAPEWVERYRGESKNLGMNWSRFTPEERIQALYRSIAQKEYEENTALDPPDKSQVMQEDVHSTHEDESPEEMDVQTPSPAEGHSMDSDKDPNKVMQSPVQEDVQLLERKLEELNVPVGLQQAKETKGQILHRMEILHFIDTGGQDIYHDVHPVLITSPSVYLVVFNLKDCFPPKADFLTSDLTQQALRSIHTLTFKSPEDNNYLRCHPEQPTIFIIGTHLDMVPSADLDSLHSAMEKKIGNMPYRNYIQYDPNGRCFWAVDNTLAGKYEGNEEYLSCLRDLIIEESAMMKLSIPIPWLLLEELTANCKPLFAYNSLCEFAKSKELVKNADEFKLMLRVFHVLGLFFYDADISEPLQEQDDYVFVNPNALYTLTSKLFLRLKEKFEEYDQEQGEINRGEINDLVKPTIEEMVKEGHLKDIFEIDPEWFIQLLCRLRLMATLGDDPRSKCIIPAILPHSRKSHQVGSPSVGSLLLTFLTSDRQFSYLPSGLFCRFIADVIRTQPGGLHWDPAKLYRNFVTFSLPFGILHIEEKKAFLKIDLTIQRDDAIQSARTIAEKCRHLRKTIHEHLREACEGLYKQSSEEFEKIATWGVPCTYHKLPEDSNQDDPGHIAEYICDPETDVFCAACLKPHSGLMQSVSRNEAVWFRDTEGELVECDGIVFVN